MRTNDVELLCDLAYQIAIHPSLPKRDVALAHQALDQAQQIFGGVGFTLEYEIQMYFRRAKQLQISWWDDRYLEELVAAATLD